MKKIFDNIIHRIKKDSLAKRQESVERHTEYKELKSLKTGLVIWCANESQDQWLDKLTHEFESIKFDRLCYVAPKDKNIQPGDALILKNEDLAFGGKIQNEELPPVLQRQYDILIDLSTESNVVLNYVLLNSQALCKIGMKREGGERDVVIDGVSEPLLFIDKLTEFLSVVKEYER